MNEALSNTVTIIALLFASIVALFRAGEEFVKTKALRLYAIAAGIAVALLAVYADKIIVK